MNKQYILKFLAGLIAVSLTQPAAFSRADQQTPSDEEEVAPRQYTFSWMFTESGTMKPRGGTTSGPEVQLDRRTSEAFSNLQAPKLDVKERDRRAILAMVGDYRTSFECIETVALPRATSPERPIRAGAERVYVVANDPDFVSLQHIIVMHFLDADVLNQTPWWSHWRQDWRYEMQKGIFRGVGPLFEEH